MADSFLGGIFGSKKNQSSQSLEDYIDLNKTNTSEDVSRGAADLYVKAAELTGLDDIATLKEEVYSGNVVLVDISKMDDELTLERAVKELRKVVDDINGDIAAMGKDQVIVTPTAVKIEREKVRSPG